MAQADRALAAGHRALIVQQRSGLADQLSALRGRDDLDAVVVPRMNLDFGYAPSSAAHRYEPQLRMYRKAAVEWPLFPNALPDVPEHRVFRIPARDELVLVHDRSRSLVEVLDRAVRYAPIQGAAMAEAGQEFGARRMLAALAEKSYREFVVAEAWDDGVPGLVRAGILVAFRFYVWVGFWEAAGRPRTKQDDAYLRRVGRAMRAADAALRATMRLRRLARR